MADEEVDWGMDESAEVDVWRQGGVQEGIVAGDEDVISLAGAEDAEGERYWRMRIPRYHADTCQTLVNLLKDAQHHLANR